MTDGRKVSANDIISGDNEKLPTNIHPVVQERLNRDKAMGLDSGRSDKITTNDTMEKPNDEYVKKSDMINFVNDLNQQLAEISRWLDIVVSDNKTLKDGFMNLQAKISDLQSRIRRS